MKWIICGSLIAVIGIVLAGVVNQLQLAWNEAMASLNFEELAKDAAYSWNSSSIDDTGNDNMIIIDFPTELGQSKQIGSPSNPIKEVTSRLPCSCKDGLCACCTGMLLQALRSKGCMNMRYVPDDFAFIFEMKMNNQVLYKNRVSGKNPKPICVNPPRIPFIEVCATIYDVYFFGRNVHACMEFGGYFQGYELFTRNFDCLRMGSQGVRIVKPEDDIPPARPGASSAGNATEAIIDAGDGIEDYDENLNRVDEQLTEETLEVTTLTALPPKPIVVVQKPKPASTLTTTTVKKPVPSSRPAKRPLPKPQKPVKNDSEDSDEDDDDDDEEEEEDDDDDLF